MVRFWPGNLLRASSRTNWVIHERWGDKADAVPESAEEPTNFSQLKGRAEKIEVPAGKRRFRMAKNFYFDCDSCDRGFDRLENFTFADVIASGAGAIALSFVIAPTCEVADFKLLSHYLVDVY
jgi:hypothetical protein